MQPFLQEFVLRAGAALEAEDRFIIGASHVRNAHGGLSRIVSERYYQAIVWRAMLSRWDAQIEKDRTDLFLGGPDIESAAIEMKLWMSPLGRREIPKIIEDVERVRNAGAHYGLILLFAADPEGKIQENLDWLQPKVFRDMAVPIRETYSFKTFDKNGGPSTFWIAVWQIKP